MSTATLDYADLSIYGPLPHWVTEIRPHQVQAIREIMTAYDEGADVVFLDAPTGSGKTLIAELVRRLQARKSLYICTDKSLQRQFIRDFPYARLLMGRGNYPTEYGPPDKTGDDCTSMMPGDPCRWCDTACPYKEAKLEALAADLAVLNTHYFLTAANMAGTFQSNPFVIVDEADALEDALVGFVEYSVPRWIMDRAKAEPPIKGARKPTLVKWLNDIATVIDGDVRRASGIVEPKLLRSMQGFVAATRSVATALQRDIDNGADGDDAGRWVRIYDKDGLHLKPVLVAPWGPKNLWRYGARWLLMSATLVSTDEMIRTLGIPYDTATVRVPMTFPVENRPLILAPIADMSYKAGDDEYMDMAYAIQRVCDLHEGDRVLVHTVSQDRAQKLIEAIEILGGLGRRKMISYRSARERDTALQRYLTTKGAVLFAQSMERGIDLPGDACRVQVIAKVPFPSLGDRRTSARMHLPGGDTWYKVQTVRSVVQMTGRGVRSKDDYATTYIFDTQFSRNLWRPDSRALFPAWWREAVDKTRDIRGFIRPR